MDFLDKLVIPRSEANLNVLYYLQMIALSALLVYSGILFGSVALSVYFNKRGSKEKSQKFTYLAKDMIDLITESNIFAFGLGVAPFLAIIMVYIQLLSGTGVPVVKFQIYAFVLYLFSLAFIYMYRHAMDLRYVFSLFKDKVDESAEDKRTRDFIEFRKETEIANSRAGFWGAVTLFVSLWLLIGSLGLGADTASWKPTNNVLNMLFSFTTISKLLHFLTASVAITAIAFLIKKFKWQDEPTFEDEAYIEFAKKFNLGAALIFVFCQPVFFVLNLLTTPKTALSSWLFGLSVVALIITFILLHYLYVMVKKNTFSYIQPAFYMLIAVIGISQIKEQTVFLRANQQNVANLAVNYVKYEEELMANAGINNVKISGEEIYKVKCMACHSFEKSSPNAPAHRDVLPKYAGNKSKLIGYITNPIKVNPAYPAMPAQGLKPKEAEEVAKYMLELFAKKNK